MSIQEIKQKIAALQQQLSLLLNPSSQMTSMENKIYTQTKLQLGKHLTLNDAIPAEVGCAEAVSKILALAGVSVPTDGIAGTASLYEWLVTNTSFVKIDVPEQGAILISPTGMGNGSVEGHTGIIGAFGVMFPGDWGICSNDSATGKWLETWSYERWKSYYEVVGNLPLYFFRTV